MPEDSGDKVLATFNAYDQEDIELYSHALYYKVAWFDLKNRLRSDYKYGEIDDKTAEFVEKLREFSVELELRYHLPED